MTDLFREPNDATPLDPALRGDLIQTWITTRADLNEAEEENIVDGAAWARRRRGGADALLNEDFSMSLHKQMFGEVWKWAGGYRQNELNIGIASHLISAEMPMMFDNARFWVENNARRNRDTAASSSYADPRLSEWQRPPCPNDGRSIGRETWREAIHVGRREYPGHRNAPCNTCGCAQGR
ncbi:fido (protein-threonine AMPylation protein) [Bradyrhizobium sp. USDA 3256]